MEAIILLLITIYIVSLQKINASVRADNRLLSNAPNKCAGLLCAEQIHERGTSYDTHDCCRYNT